MPKPTIAQLEAFSAICRLGTFQAAAEHLNVTQPTISLRIRDLERTVGKRLFQRRGRPVKLSPDGLVMRQYVDQGLALFSEMEERLRTGDPLQGSLRIGSSNVFAWTCLPAVIATIEHTYPGLKINLTATDSVQLSELLDSNRLDIAFMAIPHSRGNLMVEPLGETEIGWVGGAVRPLERLEIEPGDLGDRNILTASPPSLLSSVIADWFAAEGLPPPPLSICNNVAIIAKLVMSGVAISALPICMVKQEIETGALIRYQQRTPFRPLRISAAYPAAARGRGMSSVLRIARSIVESSGLYRPVN
jgi:DNA-binding transcriptional LysR family regulator